MVESMPLTKGSGVEFVAPASALFSPGFWGMNQLVEEHFLSPFLSLCLLSKPNSFSLLNKSLYIYL